MAKRSPFSDALHDAFDRELLPLLAAVGFSRSKVENVRPGNVVASAARQFARGRRVEAALWCDAATGAHLRFRIDVIDGQLSEEVKLEFPWPATPADPGRVSLGDFHPEESPARLALAVAFQAGVLAGNAERLAAKIPELADAIRGAAAQAWQAASKRGFEIWKARNVRGEIEDEPLAGEVAFVGESLAIVVTARARLTFRFDTSGFDRSAPVSVSGWFRTPAGTWAATKLVNGERTWTFDFRGGQLDR